MSTAPIASCSSSGTCGLRDEPHRNAGTSQTLSCTVHSHVQLFLASQTETPKPTGLASVFTQGSRMGDVHVKHIKAFEVFPESLHWYSTESWTDLQISLLLHVEDGLHDPSKSF